MKPDVLAAIKALINSEPDTPQPEVAPTPPAPVQAETPAPTPVQQEAPPQVSVEQFNALQAKHDALLARFNSAQAPAHVQPEAGQSHANSIDSFLASATPAQVHAAAKDGSLIKMARESGV